MTVRDTSSIYNVGMLDSEARKVFNDVGRPWIFETDDDITTYATEEEACAGQRAYRRDRGFDPVTGEWDDAF